MKILDQIKQFAASLKFSFENKNAAAYWENRYQRNGTSGNGSFGILAAYKARIINEFVRKNHIQKVIELGCGDGNQLKQFVIPEYIGVDVSKTAIAKCKDIFKDDISKQFFIYNDISRSASCQISCADCVLSLDVVYHLFEDDVFGNYMHNLFALSNHFVIIYAWDVEGVRSQHVRHRKFSDWILTNKKSWKLINKIANEEVPTACDFFIYEKMSFRGSGKEF